MACHNVDGYFRDKALGDQVHICKAEARRQVRAATPDELYSRTFAVLAGTRLRSGHASNPGQSQGLPQI